MKKASYIIRKNRTQQEADFLSMVGHQLRSPLTVLQIGIGALLDGTLGPLKDQRQIDALLKMRGSASRLISLVGEYLNLSRVELGKMKYSFKKHDLCALIKDIVEEYQPRAKAKGLNIIFIQGKEIATPRLRSGLAMTKEKKQSRVLLLKFDDEKLRHVIVNLVDNAIKYTVKGSIVLRAEVVGQGVRVSVRDTGMGIAQQDSKKIFEKFYRGVNVVGSRQGKPIEGSGLGLHVAKILVEAHGGTILAQSKGYGKGSTFIVTLPLYRM
ncbi:MAG: HAMP domain-containing sensor histidine kinase [bacterium]|nr:HAMP domain-containing sensor histidine kinase [bacterium]